MKTMIKKTELFFNSLCTRLSNLLHSTRCLVSSSLDNLILILLSHRLYPFWMHLGYFMFFSVIGFLGLKGSKPKSFTRPRDIDLYFTSVSAVTVSSMSTVEMEVFSNFQLIILITLILLGGEVFVSIIRLQFSKYSKFITAQRTETIDLDSNSMPENHVELGLITDTSQENEIQNNEDTRDYIITTNSVKCLCYTVLGYFIMVHVIGSSSLALYILSLPSAKQVLENKGIRVGTFSFFVTASSFTNCGFIPTNENMMVFKKNSGLLLILIPQLLVGSSLYPLCLLLVILVLGRVTKRPEFRYILKNYKELGYNSHLMSKRGSAFLGATVLGFIVIQFIVFVAMEWNSGVMDGLNWYEKVVASLFQVVNTRHAGESVFDLSVVSPAVLVLFVVMMYLPTYTSFLPVEDGEKGVSSIHNKTSRRQIDKKKKYVEYLLLSQASYLVIFIILICISERHNLKEDPLNFSVLNIVIEVISAYGNVGYSIAYSCKRQIKHDGMCKDTYYGFAGRWSDNGKLILIVVMFFGRLKNFHSGGGTAWKLQ